MVGIRSVNADMSNDKLFNNKTIAVNPRFSLLKINFKDLSGP